MVAIRKEVSYNQKKYTSRNKGLDISNTVIDFLEYKEYSQKKLKSMVKNIQNDIDIEVEKEQVNISDLVNDNFKDFWYSTDSIQILKGGRSSLKSSAASLKLVVKMIEQELCNVVCLRKVAAYLRTSVYSQITWAIHTLGLQEHFTFYRSPLVIMHNDTNTGFYFYGVDDPQKIKSTKVTTGYVGYVWAEEAAEFKDKEELDIVMDTFIRQVIKDNEGKHIPVQQIFTYNPPRNPYVWINEWLDELEATQQKDVLINHSTYDQDKKGFLSQQFLDKIAQIKRNDPDYYRWMYRGEVVGYGDNVYNFGLFQQIDELPADDRIVSYHIVLDTGYSVSATTFLHIALTAKDKVILIDTYYYSPEGQMKKKAPSDFAKDLHDFSNKCEKYYADMRMNVPNEKIIIDSADGALRNEYYKLYSVFLEPARKKKNIHMIENVEDLLAMGRVYVLKTENNKVFLEEHKRYQWIPETKDTDDPKVLKENDHTCDAFKYFVNNNLVELGLKF